MRFACDRCKTRYSIADERVRGKILKIRCKSCANVITVKEGMDAPPEMASGGVPTGTAPAADRSAATASGLPERPEWSASSGAVESAAATASAKSGPAASGRAYRPTTMAPQSTVGSGGAAPLTPAPKPAAALGAAFATAMAGAQAPAQLEDEWYVSRDGDQQGPFSLPDAQAWISQHPYDAELYCWCEGFDDWLPVDRIAHFRGLRPRPVPPSAPPPSGPLSRPAPLVAPAGAAASPSVAASTAPQNKGERPPLSGPLPLLGRSPTRPTGANPLAPASAATAALGNGAAGPAGAAGSVDDKPQFAATMAALGGSPAAAPTGTPNGNGLGRAAFDAGDLGDLGSPGFSSEGPRRSAIGSSNPVPPAASLPGTDSDDLEFGEVSRVVRIADIGKTMRPQARAASSAGLPSASSTPPKSSPAMAPASVPFSPVSAPPSSSASPSGLGGLSSAGTGSHGIVGAPHTGGDSVRVPVPLVIPAKQRRNHALLLGAVAVGLIGAGVAAFFLLSSREPEDPAMISLSAVDVSDLTIRPDEPRRGSGDPEPAGSGAAGSGAAPTRPTNPTAGQGVKRPGTGSVAANPGGSVDPTPGGKVETAPVPGVSTPLGADEVEQMSQKNSSGLQRCYEAALKKDIFLEVKSIKVTLSIDATGVVTNVAMSSHADHPLGQCMISRIRNWRFRANSRGLDAKFTVAFGRT